MNDTGHTPDDQLVRLHQLDRDSRRRLAARDVARAEFRCMMENVVAALPNALPLADEDGDIIPVITKSEFPFRDHRHRMIGQNVGFPLPEAARPRHIARRSVHIETPRLRSMGLGRTLRVRRYNGRESPVEIMLAPVSTRRGVFAPEVLRRAFDE